MRSTSFLLSAQLCLQHKCMCVYCGVPAAGISAIWTSLKTGLSVLSRVCVEGASATPHQATESQSGGHLKVPQKPVHTTEKNKEKHCGCPHFRMFPGLSPTDQANTAPCLNAYYDQEGSSRRARLSHYTYTHGISQKWVQPSHFCKYFTSSFHGTTLTLWYNVK